MLYGEKPPGLRTSSFGDQSQNLVNYCSQYNSTKPTRSPDKSVHNFLRNPILDSKTESDKLQTSRDVLLEGNGTVDVTESNQL